MKYCQRLHKRMEGAIVASSGCFDVIFLRLLFSPLCLVGFSVKDMTYSYYHACAIHGIHMYVCVCVSG